MPDSRHFWEEFPDYASLHPGYAGDFTGRARRVTPVLGMGRDATPYMEQREVPEDEGEILVIEVDGKATPTATTDELKKRRGKREKKTSYCTRHRNKDKRQRCHKQGKNRHKKKGDKRKNGRSITLLVIYTLKRGDDGKLHGPINKQVWGSYAPRKVMLAWARRQATKRGFPPDTQKRTHIVIDGELCLYEGLVKLFPKATFALDIRHLEEKIWEVGHAFHKKGVSLPRERFWDIPVAKIDSPTRQLLLPRPPCIRAAPPHHRKLGAGSAALPQWLDGVSDARAYGLRRLRDLRPLRHSGHTHAPTPTGDYPPRASHFHGGQRRSILGQREAGDL